MSQVRSSYFFLVIMLLTLVAGLSSAGMAAAAEVERGISLSTTYPSITIARNQSVTLPIKLADRGQVDEQLNISISSAPEGWVADLLNKEAGDSYRVRSLYLVVGEEPRLIYFRAKPPAGVEPGDYIFLVEAVSRDGVVRSSLKITIGIEEKVTVLGRVTLTATYPDLRGPSGESFEFKIAVTNEGSEDQTFSFSAEAPRDWEVTFHPAYEQRLISALGVKAGKSEDIKVQLTPSLYVSPGTYFATVKAASGNIEGAVKLTITVFEKERELTKELEMLTLTGRLDTEAIAGRETYLPLLVTNRGSAELERINFYATKPEGWTVTFTPQTIPSMVPGESREVAVVIMPTSKTIAGDYSLTLRGNAIGVADSIELRVTVGQSTVWGWVGLAIVLVVIAGMVTVFWRLGRR